ncbi:DUF4249 domain-containing protein [Flexithrix dorotheae]|uniref:DUF4249 domain-containing protein n=1 Tax=Flexithrix dorotheae TaxID=70993 RepID=UPI00035D9A88|nr:DUF4249 domain-containing protein [Flexithrix dorotheae]
MKRFIIYISIITVVGFYACVEPFHPILQDSASEILVVEGLITNEEGPYRVIFSKSTNLETQGIAYVSGIEVSIEEENGNQFALTEVETGIFETNAAEFKGTSGKSYRLNFYYNEEQYQSDWETLEASPEIDSIYYRKEIQETTDKDVNIPGIQFYIDTHGEVDDPRYYRWEWEEAWEIGVNYPALYEYLGNDETRLWEQPKNLCYQDDISQTININTTQNLSENVISQHKIPFVSNDFERLSRKYSLLVRQYAMEEEEYLFWKNLQESNEALGSLYDRQPARVIGNIKNLTNPGTPVLGYFSANGVISQRLFVPRRDVPHGIVSSMRCELDTIMKSPISDDEVFEAIGFGQIFWEFLYSETGPGVAGYLMSIPQCSDCEAKGGYLEKPDFWE